MADNVFPASDSEDESPTRDADEIDNASAWSNVPIDKWHRILSKKSVRTREFGTRSILVLQNKQGDKRQYWSTSKIHDDYTHYEIAYNLGKYNVFIKAKGLIPFKSEENLAKKRPIHYHAYRMIIKKKYEEDKDDQQASSSSNNGEDLDLMEFHVGDSVNCVKPKKLEK